MATTLGYRALHYVLKIGNRKEAIDFLKGTLGMKVLRHEEFEKGCEATCNGPYDGRWSKTMIGFGPEDSNFVLELTYNYGVDSYQHGNSLLSIEILKEDVSKVRELGAKLEMKARGTDEAWVLISNGYRFEIVQSMKGDKISGVTLAGTKVVHVTANAAHNFYEDMGMQFYSEWDKKYESFNYGPDQAYLEVAGIESEINHGTAFGRFAFACPTTELSSIEKKIPVVMNGVPLGEVLTPLIELETPGKASVSVVIIKDPFGHEICFVGDEGFRKLSVVDPAADDALSKSIDADKSKEWFEKRGLTKESS